MKWKRKEKRVHFPHSIHARATSNNAQHTQLHSPFLVKLKPFKSVNVQSRWEKGGTERREVDPISPFLFIFILFVYKLIIIMSDQVVADAIMLNMCGITVNYQIQFCWFQDQSHRFTWMDPYSSITREININKNK